MTPRRRLALLALPALLLVAGALATAYFLYFAEKEKRPDRLALTPAAFGDLPGWRDDRQAEALPALVKSCKKILARQGARGLGGSGFAGTAADWQGACRGLLELAGTDQPADQPTGQSVVGQSAGHPVVRRYLEENFQPFLVSNNDQPEGLFTGYYEAGLKGSRTPSARYAIPLHARPPELVTVDLGLFREELKGQRIAGRVEDGRFRPYSDRAEIEQGALEGRGLELVWVDDPVDAFFLHIQGSGRIDMEDGSTLRVGYAGQNGHLYHAVGRDLIESGAIPREKMSMQSIRDWMEANADAATALMRRNPSYVFFKELDGDGPIGAQNLALTPGRSLAVDRKWMPLGVPLWLDTTLPTLEGEARPFRRLFVAQDTGGAIRGPVRGDVFWGHGDQASDLAGRMKQPGRYWVLLPKAVARKAASIPADR